MQQFPDLMDHVGGADGNHHGQDEDHAGIDRTNCDRLRDTAPEGLDHGLQRRRQHDADKQQEQNVAQQVGDTKACNDSRHDQGGGDDPPRFVGMRARAIHVCLFPGGTAAFFVSSVTAAANCSTFSISSSRWIGLLM